MPIVKRLKAKSESSSSAKSAKPEKVKRSPLVISLPDGPEEPVKDLRKIKWLIYGENKIGKTSLCAQFPDPIFLMFEPGGDFLRIARRQMGTWREFVAYVDAILRSERYGTVVIDPAARCFKMLVDDKCEELGVDDPRDVGWGQGWKAIQDEFERQIHRLTKSGRGVVFLAKPTKAEFERRTGGTYHRIEPKLSSGAGDFIEGFVDVIAFYGYYGDERFLTIRGSDELDAGCRPEELFLTTQGEQVHSIPMGSSAKEGYKNLVAAFDNKQKSRCEPEREASVGRTKAQAAKKRKLVF